MMVFTVDKETKTDREISSSSLPIKNQNILNNNHNRVASGQISTSTSYLNSNNNSPSSSCNLLTTRCFVLFAICAICFIVMCSIFMAVMTTSVLMKTNNLDNDFFLKSKSLASFFANTNESFFESNKLERNVFSWLRDKIQQSFFNKSPKLENFNQPLENSMITPKQNKLQECGSPLSQPRFMKTRIMNGKEAVPNSWPWTVSIGLEGPREFIPHACGGTLINKRTVVTAAHCVIRNSVFSLVGGPVRHIERFSSVEKMMRIYIGVHDRLNDIRPNRIYSVESIKMHENFDPITFKNDIALIRLDRDVEETNLVGFACLTKNSQILPGDIVYAVGWGYTEKSKTQASRYLMQVDLTIQRKENCLIQYIDNDQFCAGNIAQKKDTCNGDSGGPLLKFINSKWTLVGVVSNGDVSCAGTGIYINVSYFFDWIMVYSRL